MAGAGPARGVESGCFFKVIFICGEPRPGEKMQPEVVLKRDRHPGRPAELPAFRSPSALTEHLWC